MSDFVCYYCGKKKPAGASSDEHIIPSCIGGNRNITLTTDVCGDCNQVVGDHVDLPFCRDWFIESMRLVAGVSHRGKRPATFMGRLKWPRAENVGIYMLQGGATIYAIDLLTGERVLVIRADPHDIAAMGAVKNVIDAKFKGRRIVNGPGQRSAEDEALLGSLLSLGESLPVTWSVDAFAWHREVVKIALGLASQIFGTEFVRSAAADKLRAFLHEPDPAARDAMNLRGRGGVRFSTPTATAVMHPGNDEHLFVLMASGRSIGLAANFFGRFENIVEVDDSGGFLDRLPGDIPGLAWVVEPARKITRGPVAVAELIVEALRQRESANEDP